MGALADAFTTLKPWQVVLLLVLIAGTSGATYGAYVLVAGSEGADVAENQQLIPVQRGDLINDVSINGTLVYANRETLRFSSQGTVEELLVEEGQRVEQGQVLARLDAETLANLAKVVAQARLNLRNAEEALDEAKDPHSALVVAKNEADVANASLSLRKRS